MAEAVAPMHVKWEGLAVVVGKTVSIAMPGGAVITSSATGVEADALVAYPKGVVRVPRAMLHRFEIETKGKVGRSVATPMGSLVGFGTGFGAWIGLAAAGTVGGYFIGNSVDKHWTPVEILS
jgi:uncharacterized protein YcfJ